MGILGSMYTGITGLQGMGEALSVYGDNIANANTVGFKTSRPEFQDVVAKSLKGILGGNQIGRGTKLAAVNPILNQGSIMQTDSATDLAITGDGFFTLQGIDGQSFSRNGAFHFDKDGFLINADGYKVQGFQADENGKITSKMGNISVTRTVIDAKPTKKVDMYMNLDLKADKRIQFNPEKPDETAHFATGTTVFDSAGTAHVVTVYFNKTDDGTWTWRAMAKGEEVKNGQKGTMVEQARGTLYFGTDGRLKDQVVNRSQFNFANGALPNQEINFSFGEDQNHGGAGLQVTQYGSTSEAYKTIQDGFAVGTLAGLSFSDDGSLAASYTNGAVLNVAQVALAKFENTEGLFKLGQNRFKESRLSGTPTIGAPQTGSRGSISAKTIEASTTDIAQEFINLITTQRNFQANSRVISVADDMMNEVINIRK